VNSLRRHHATDRPRLRVVCFPHAGGSASFFRAWPDALPADVDVFAVQYPGHEDRISEPLADDLRSLAADQAESLAPLLDVPVLLFGHSMGALVAFETARRIESLVPRARIALAVSAATAPDVSRDLPDDIDTDDVLADHLSRLGGMAPEVLADPDMRDIMLPVVRHDYRLVRRYRDVPEPRLRCPILAFCGEDDPAAGYADMERWASRTAGRFSSRAFAGGHFYLVPHRSELLKELGAWPPSGM